MTLFHTTKFQAVPKQKILQTTHQIWLKKQESFWTDKKIPRKVHNAAGLQVQLGISIFFIYHNVFKRLHPLGCRNKGFYCTGFSPYQATTFGGLTKLKAFADDKFNVAKLMISLFDWVEIIVERGEKSGYQHFLLFPQSSPFDFRVSETRDYVVKSQLCSTKIYYTCTY